LLRENDVTYDEYAAWDDGNRYELVDGRLELMSPGPNSTHQLVAVEMLTRISQTCKDVALILTAPIDVILAPKEVRQPDLVILLRSNLHRLTKRGIEGPPDIVAEILSPSTSKRDRLSKTAAYAKYGIPEYWIVDPAHFYLEQHVLEDGRYRLANLFAERDVVATPRLPCVSFSMQDIADTLPEQLR
jgi:Uma2 family endonuclease